MKGYRVLKRNLGAIFIFVLVVACTEKSSGFDLNGTYFAEVGNQYGIDPLLLYAVALAESASGRGEGNISPWPWTLRTGDRAIYSLTQAEAYAELEEIIKSQGERAVVDIGLMQVNLYWNGHRASSLSELLDPRSNIEIGAQVLLDALRSAPEDLELAVGRYHHWRKESVARAYGKRVIGIYGRLRKLAEQRTEPSIAQR